QRGWPSQGRSEKGTSAPAAAGGEEAGVKQPSCSNSSPAKAPETVNGCVPEVAVSGADLSSSKRAKTVCFFLRHFSSVIRRACSIEPLRRRSEGFSFHRACEW